jgi:hypothetical protein
LKRGPRRQANRLYRLRYFSVLMAGTITWPSRKTTFSTEANSGSARRASATLNEGSAFHVAPQKPKIRRPRTPEEANRHLAGLPSLARWFLPKLQSAAYRAISLVCAMATHPINDYYVITSRAGEHPERWSWEIRRKSKPLGIKMTADGFQSQMAANLRGSARWRIFCPIYRKRRKVRASKVALSWS